MCLRLGGLTRFQRALSRVPWFSAYLEPEVQVGLWLTVLGSPQNGYAHYYQTEQPRGVLIGSRGLTADSQILQRRSLSLRRVAYNSNC